MQFDEAEKKKDVFLLCFYLLLINVLVVEQIVENQNSVSHHQFP